MSAIDRRILPEKIRSNRGAFRIAGIYLVVAGLWILFGDRLAQVAATSPAEYRTLATAIDWCFALVTGFLLFWLIRQETAAIQERESQIRLIADSVPVMIASIDSERSYRFFNRAYRDLYAIPPARVGGKCLEEVLSAEADPHHAGYIDQVLAGREVSFDQSIVDPKGEKRFFSVSYIPDIAADGQVRGFYSLRTDITGRVQAEAEREALLAENGRQKALLDAIFEADPSCLAVLVGAEMRIAYANPAYRFLTPEISFDPIGKPYAEVWAPEASLGLHDQVREMVETGRPFKAYPFVRVFPDGTRRIFKFQGRRIDWQGQQAGLLTLWDVTDQEEAKHLLSAELDLRRQAEAALAARNEEIQAMTQQLWQASKLATMGELAASVAHEINNPLAILSLRVENLETKLPDSFPGKNDLTIMGQEIDRIARIVSNLLQFSRSGERRFSSLNIVEEIDSTLELVQTHLANRSIQLEEEISSQTPLIFADRQQMRQVFLNLITNASDAMPEGGTLKIKVRPSEDGSQVMIEMQDTGIGIPPEDLPRLTDPFFTTKPEGKGTGLGLAICRRIIDEHQGTFEVTSPGRDQGTTARIALPRKTNSSSLAEETD